MFEKWNVREELENKFLFCQILLGVFKLKMSSFIYIWLSNLTFKVVV